MATLSGKIAVVTGGAQGIGRGITKRFLEKGMGVVMADIDDEAGEETIKEYRMFDNLHYIQTDVRDEDSVRQCIETTMARCSRLDVLVNNAGIFDPVDKVVDDLSLEEWDQIIRTNLTGYFLMVKYAAPHLRQNRGAVVNIASTRAFQSELHSAAYAASKGGVISLTHALAVSLGPDVRVNSISPGWIEVRNWQKLVNREIPNHSAADREQHPVGRVGQPEDIAAMAAFLVSDESGFITGQNYVVDGGMSRKMVYAD